MSFDKYADPEKSADKDHPNHPMSKWWSQIKWTAFWAGLVLLFCYIIYAGGLI